MHGCIKFNLFILLDGKIRYAKIYMLGLVEKNDVSTCMFEKFKVQKKVND